METQTLITANSGVIDSPAAGIWRKVGAVAVFAVLTALAAQVKVILPGSPVPVTLQTLTVVLAGMTLGPILGTASMLFYLVLGMTGYAVFALGFGPAALWGPTGGYLVGFVVAQPVIGWLATRRWNPWLRMSAAALAGHAIILALGGTWLAIISGNNFDIGWTLGVLPFLPGSLIKSAPAIVLARPLQRFVGR